MFGRYQEKARYGLTFNEINIGTLPFGAYPSPSTYSSVSIFEIFSVWPPDLLYWGHQIEGGPGE